MRTKLPNWNRDPFHTIPKKEKKLWKEILKGAHEELRDKCANGIFSLSVPKRLPGRMVEPESMTRKRRGRKSEKKYMDPAPKMEPPKIWRGRGRTWRLDREVNSKIRFCLLIRLENSYGILKYLN